MWRHPRVGVTRASWRTVCQEWGFQGNERCRPSSNSTSSFSWTAIVGGGYLKYQNISLQDGLSELFCFPNAKMLWMDVLKENFWLFISNWHYLDPDWKIRGQIQDNNHKIKHAVSISVECFNLWLMLLNNNNKKGFLGSTTVICLYFFHLIFWTRASIIHPAFLVEISLVVIVLWQIELKEVKVSSAQDAWLVLKPGHGKIVLWLGSPCTSLRCWEPLTAELQLMSGSAFP